MTTKDFSQWDELKYRRRLETFGPDDAPIVASGPKAEYDGICQPGELTDKGRSTTLALGERLRHLYVDQLHFMPALIASADLIYLRATPLSRALESVQQTFWGLYPPTARTASFPPPTILTRTPADETLYPNDGNCRRFAQLSRAFADRAAQRWNASPEMAHLNERLGKWMPAASPRIAVDSHPRLSGLLDTVNSTLAHGPETRLPSEFYEPEVRRIIDQVAVEEWFAGYEESREYRALGIGALVGDVAGRMVASAARSGRDGVEEVGDARGGNGESGAVGGRGRGGERELKLTLAGCHDTTLAGLLTSLGAFEGEPWPPYTSHIAIELFRKRDAGVSKLASESAQKSLESKGWFSALFGRAKEVASKDSESIARRPMEELSEKERDKLAGYFVRLRYNDRPMTVPGCKAPGKHLEGNESFCTLARASTRIFKMIVG
ncbi:MAG: hypothetical protein M1822_007221 [Bathelium mastoideum]|nr:MAG: hypothetical protein M1822_007221 [Bathelium mastoideum]